MPAPKDDPGHPIPIPRRRSNRVKSPENTPLSSGPPTAVLSGTPTRETARVTASSQAQDKELKPIVPLKAGRNSPRQIYASPATSPQFRPTGYPSPVSPTAGTFTPTQHMQEHYHAGKLGDEVYPRRGPDADTNKSARAPTTSDDQDPVSRFSWTTTATSTTYQNPPPSPPPPLPTAHLSSNAPQSIAVTQSPADSPTGGLSILNRGHPTRRLGEQATDPPSPPYSGRTFSMGSTTRKPIGTAPAVQPPYTEDAVIHQPFPLADWRSGSTSKVRERPSLAPSTTSATQGKSLPKTPQELASADLITSLQAQQNDLLTQRRNIHRLIGDLERPEATNPLLNGFKEIREREKKLASLKEDLDEVVRKQYDCGLRLHRAWKRRERDDPNTPESIFWVRRVTDA